MHRHKAQIISDWFLEHDNEFTLLKWPPQSPDLNPVEQLWDVVEREIHIMDVQPTNLQQLCDAIMTIWPTSLRNVSNTLLNLCHEELRQTWRQKGVQPGTSKVYLIKWPVSVYTSIKKKEIWHWILAYCFLKSPLLFSMLTFAASQPYEANRRPAWSVNWGPPVSRVPGGPSGPGPARKPALDAGWCSPGWCECSSQSNRLIGRENYRLCR